MLILHTKGKWFRMIAAREKPEEYREIKPYYTSRLKKICLFSTMSDEAFIEELKDCGDEYVFYVQFRNGYSKNAPSFIALCTLTVGTGKEEWGAEPGKNYYRLHIKEISKEGED